MNLPTWYSAGTVSVESGSTTVTGTGTLWGDDAIMVGDLFCDPAQPLVPPQRVKEVSDNGELELWAPWPGDDVEDAAYEIRYVGIIERSTYQTRKVLEQLGDVKAWYDVIVEDDDARLALETEGSPLRAKFRVLVMDDGVIWAKATGAYGDWIGPVEFKGDKGDKGDLGPRGVKPRGDYSGATAYVEGDAVLNNGSTWVALGSTTGNAPPTLPTTSNTYWQLLSRAGANGTGTGDVVGPASAVADRVAVFSGTTGKLLKDGGKTIAELIPANNTVTNAILADMATARIKGRISASTGDPEDLTGGDVMAIIMAAGQVPFPATQNPSSDPNTLDDYEEGTWTPTLTATSNCSALALTYGRYTKIGNLVTLEAVVTGTITASNVRTVIILTLPFNQFQTQSGASGTCIEQNNSAVGGIFDSSGGSNNAIAAVLPVASAPVAGAAYFNFAITYRAA